MKQLLIILALTLSTPAQAATAAPDTVQTQQTYLPTAYDFGNLKYDPAPKGCQRTPEQKKAAERRGWAALIVLTLAVIAGFMWGFGMFEKKPPVGG